MAGRVAAPACPAASAAVVRTDPAGAGEQQVGRRGLGLGLPGLELGLGRGLGWRSRSNRTVARSTPETPSTSEWWVLKMSAKRSSSRPSIIQLSHSGRSRSSCWEAIRAGQPQQLLLAAGRRQRGVADVVLEVEARIVDPQRATALQRRHGELLAVARHQVQPAADVVEVIGEVRRRALEDEHGADVHVRAAPLLVQERGVRRGEAVEMLLGHADTRSESQGEPQSNPARRSASPPGAGRLHWSR